MGVTAGVMRCPYKSRSVSVVMDESRFGRLTALVSGVTSRRLAVATAAVGGLALAGQAAAKDDVNAEGKKRGRRGKKGKQGPQGPAGPVSGSDAVLVTEPCTFSVADSSGVGTTDGCTATCANGFVAVGGGFQGPAFIDAIGHVVSSFPTQTGSNPPDGWETTVEYLDFGQSFDVTTYVICLPA